MALLLSVCVYVCSNSCTEVEKPSHAPLVLAEEVSREVDLWEARERKEAELQGRPYKRTTNISFRSAEDFCSDLSL